MNDLDYIERVKNGELDAYKFLVEEYKDQALAVAIRVVKDPDLAEDVLQEAFVNAYTNLKKFRAESSFKTWLFRIVYNQAIMVVRHSKVAQNHLESVKEHMYTNDSSTFDSLKLYDQQRIIEQTFEKMTEKEAVALQLFYLEELSVKEIEDVMGITKDHVKVVLHRARKNFYALISKTSENELIALI